jgi:Cyclin
MDGHSDHQDSDGIKIPSDWENNTVYSYSEYYASLNLEEPTLATLGVQLAVILTEIVESHQEKECQVTPFTILTPLPITLEDYIARIIKYSCCSAETYVLALIYIDNYHRERETTFLNRQNVHK